MLNKICPCHWMLSQHEAVGSPMRLRAWLVLGVCWFAMSFAPVAGPAFAQFRVARPNGLVQIMPAVEPVSIDDEEAMTMEGGGVVKTDPELESIMEKAQRYRDDGNFRVATQLWQAVLDRSGDTLFSSDKNQTYYSMVTQVEEVISKLPPDGLNVYRVNADAKAKEILAAANDPNDLAALSQIVRKYFLSSQGDDAAFRLGALYLEEYDFVGALRLFDKIIDRYPDPSVSLAEVHARRALCNAFLGEMESAKTSVTAARKIDSGSRAVSMIDEAIRQAEQGKPFAASMQFSERSQDWLMSGRLANRRGIGTAPPASMMEQDLVAVWQYAFDPKDQYKTASDTVGTVLLGGDAYAQAANKSRMTDKEKQLLERWQEKLWRPVGEVLFDDELVYFKSGADLTAWNRDQIESLIRGELKQPKLDSFIGWRSVQRNYFEVDAATRIAQSIKRNLGQFRQRTMLPNPNSPTPALASDVQLFGDRIFSQMSIVEDHIYSIEGIPFDDRSSYRPKPVTSVWNQSYRHTRSNQLVAYHAKTGMVQWRLPRENANADENEQEESEWLVDGGFMGAPIGFDQMVIVPVNRGGAIWLYALDPATEGKTIWKANLSDEPEVGSPSWPSIQLSIEGSDLFVTCGHGLIFIVDPATGVVRLAKRYPRVGVIDPAYRRSNWTVKRALFNGWDDDVVIPYGSQAISFCSDTNLIQAIDRNTGKQLWNCEMTPIGYKIDYLLGIHQDRLYAAGRETIVAFDLKGEGRMLWGAEQLFNGKNSLGRGWLTPKGIFMPVQNEIIQFALDDDESGGGKQLASVNVDLGGAPVGNLYCDGNRFWVHTGNRLYALGTKQESAQIDRDKQTSETKDATE